MTLTRKPKFSVVIPTRERCDTLASTLQTCLDQNYEDCEIIVSDNFSQDDTKAITASFKDARLRYINTGARVSMTHNWEFALSHVRGEYVTYVGDDDALLPGALAALASIIDRTDARAIIWQWASYFWPSSVHAPSRNLLFVPLGKRLEARSAPLVLRDVLAFRTGYQQLPFFYKGVVHSDLIAKVRHASGGDFFHSMVPDVYSAIALSLVTDTYYYSYRPYSMNGTSGHSNGAAQFSPSLNAPAAQAFLNENNIPFHRDLVLAPSLAVAVAESFLQAAERMETAAGYQINLKEVLRAAVLEMAGAESQRYAQVSEALRGIAAKHQLTSYLEELLAKHPNRPPTILVGLTAGHNVLNNMHVVDGAPLGIRNIHQASAVCAAILNARELGFIGNPLAIARTTATLGKRVVRRTIARWIGGTTAV